MDRVTKDTITKVLDKYQFDDDEKKLIEYSNTAMTAEANHMKSISTLILAKQLITCTDRVIDSNNALKDAEDKNSRIMQWLTGALIFVGSIQALSMVISVWPKH